MLNHYETKDTNIIREQVWLTNFAQVYSKNVTIKWCKNNINVF